MGVGIGQEVSSRHTNLGAGIGVGVESWAVVGVGVGLVGVWSRIHCPLQLTDPISVPIKQSSP